MDAQSIGRRTVLDASGAALGTARVETLNVPDIFGPYLPAKLSDVDFDATALHPNDDVVVACDRGCQPLSIVLTTVIAQDKPRTPSVYIFMAKEASGHTRRCARKEECRNFMQQPFGPPEEGAA